MASNQPTPSREAPLSFMDSLSPAVSYFQPASPSPPPPSDPSLIVLFTWFAARDVHIAKYTAQHRALFPASPILLVRSTVRHVFFPPSARRELLAAVPVLQAAAAADKEPRVLVHVFSNGGSASAVHTYGLARAQGVAVPRHVTVLDSCPGYFHWRRTHLALSQALPWWASPLVHVALACTWLVSRLRGVPVVTDRTAAALNDAGLVGVAPRRAYMYGTGDEMVDWRDVERHAAEARAAGFEVRLEKFEGGKHVAHVRVDGDRYWRAMKEIWEETM